MNKPYLRWVGSKSRIIGDVIDAIGKKVNGRLIEPFAGTCVVSLNVDAEEYILNDMNDRLINTHEMCIENPEEVIEELGNLLAFGRDAYYENRTVYNSSIFKKLHPTIQAALFIYLNRTGFQGLYRCNKSGGFNVPVGKGNIKSSYDEIYEFCEFKNATFTSTDFEEVINQATEHDVVYVDPPYYAASATMSEVKYTDKGFTHDDQVRLRDACVRATERGAKVVISNVDIEVTRDLYSGADEVRSIEVTRSVSSSKSSRGKVNELICIYLPKDLN